MSKTTVERLVYMANQIARNLSTTPDMDAAMATADHIKQFWDPRMIAGVKTVDRSTLSPIAQRAIELVDGDVPHQTRATQFAGVNDVGHSDAG